MLKTGLLRTVALSMAFIFMLSGCNWNDDSDNGVTTKRLNDTSNRQNGVNRMGVTPPTLLPSLRPDNSGVLHDNTRLTQSQKTAQRLTKMNEISSATVLLSDQNAYVGVRLNVPQYGGQRLMGTPNRDLNGMDSINKGLKEKIARKVKQENPTIKNVYISASPNFLRKFEGYSNQVIQGNPVKSFISQFNEAMRGSFPINDNDNDKNNNVWK